MGAPRVVFADEPTSGLDSQLAASVVRTLARLAKGGAIVVFSIHQPSQRCFDLCDDLVVLAHGKTLYTGPAADAVRTLAPPPDIMTLPPAEAILEVAARDAPTAAPALVKAPRRFSTARAPSPAAPFHARALALAHRGVVTQLRRWPLIVAQFATCAVFASLIGMLYEGDGVPRIDQKGVENVNGYLVYVVYRDALLIALPAAAIVLPRLSDGAPRGGVGRLRPAALGPRHAARGCRAAAGPPVRLRQRDVPAHRPAARLLEGRRHRRVPARGAGGGLRGRVARLFDRLFVPRLAARPRLRPRVLLRLRRRRVSMGGGSATARFCRRIAVATVVAPLFVFPMILLGGLYANVGAIPTGARWINKVCLRAREAPSARIYHTPSMRPARRTGQIRSTTASAP